MTIRAAVADDQAMVCGTLAGCGISDIEVVK